MSLAGTKALTTLATVKTELGISVSTYDAELERLILTASDAIESYCRRSLTRATVTDERHRANGQLEFYLKRTPVNAVTSITIDGTALDSTDYELIDANAGLVRLEVPFQVRAPVMSGISQHRVTRLADWDYKVTYSGGWLTATQESDGDGTRDIPYDLESACVRLVSYYWGTKGAIGEVASERLGEASVSYFKPSSVDGGSGLPGHVTATLRRYRRSVIL